MLNPRDVDVLKHIFRYCTEIEYTVERFGRAFETFSQDFVYRNAAALCVLQIGELAAKLTAEFKETYTQMPWNQMKAMRNVVAHDYGSIDAEILWGTVENDIPALKEYCGKILRCTV